MNLVEDLEWHIFLKKRESALFWSEVSPSELFVFKKLHVV